MHTSEDLNNIKIQLVLVGEENKANSDKVAKLLDENAQLKLREIVSEQWRQKLIMVVVAISCILGVCGYSYLNSIINLH